MTAVVFKNVSVDFTTKLFSVYGTVQRYERGYKEIGHNEIKMALRAFLDVFSLTAELAVLRG